MTSRSQATRDSLKRGDPVFVIRNLGGGHVKRVRAKVLETLRGAARVEMEGRPQPILIKYPELELDCGDDPPEGEVVAEVEDIPDVSADPWCPSCGAAPGTLHAVTCALEDVERHTIEPDPHRPCLDPDAMHGAADGFGGSDVDSHYAAHVDRHYADEGRVPALAAPPPDDDDAPPPSVPPGPPGGGDGRGNGDNLDALLSDAQVILDMRRPIVNRLERKLEEMLRVRREVNRTIGRIEGMLDALNADSSDDDLGSAEPATPRDRERIARYHDYIDEALSAGPATWNEIRAYVLEEHPGVDTRLLGSALSGGKKHGRYAHDGNRGGQWSLAKGATDG